MSGDGVINPDRILIPDADPDAIEAAGKALKGDAGDIAQAGHDIKTSWSGLEGHYLAPESEELLAAVDPVADDGDTMDDRITTVGQALIDFAEEIRPLLARWKSLKADAETMADQITEAGEDWTKDEDRVEAHNQLNDDLAAVQTDYQAAERECANTITALVEGGTRFIAAHLDGSTVADDGEMVYGLAEAPQGRETAWATPQDHDAPWWADVGAALWDIGAGTVTDVASMVGLYHDQRGWGVSSLSEWGANFRDYQLDSLEGAAYLTGLYDGTTWGVDSPGQWWGNFSGAWKEVGHSIVPWREWDTRPGYVITTGVVNIGSMVAGTALTATGVGAVVGAPLLAWRGTRVMRTISNLGDILPNSPLDRFDPASHLGNLLGGRSPGEVTTDLGDTTDALNTPPTRIDALNDALTNANNFGHPPSGDSGTPPGNTPDTGDVSPTRPGGDEPAATADSEDHRPPQQPGDSEQPAQDTHDGTDSGEDGGTGGSASLARTPDTTPSDTGQAAELPTTEQILRLHEEIEHFLRQNAEVPVGAGVGGHSPGGGLPDSFDPTAHHDTPGSTPGSRSEGPADLPGAEGGDGGPGSGEYSRSGTLDLGGGGSGHGPADGSPTSPGPGDGGGPGSGSGGGELPPPVRIGADHPLAPEPGKPFGRDGGLAPNARYEVVDSSGRPRGTYITDADGNIDRIRIDQNSPLAPGRDDRFGENEDLDPDARYEVVDAAGRPRGTYTTDANGEITKLETRSGKPRSWNPELRNPRPDMTYVVDGRYTYRTDHLARTVSMEGELELRKGFRGPDQTPIGHEGRDEYRDLNQETLRQFEEKYGRTPQSGEVPLYENARWNGGHLVGTQFNGPGERINMVPMLEAINQAKIPNANHVNNFYRLEEHWADLLRRQPPPKIHVKINCIYSSDMKSPRTIRVDYSVDGIPADPVRLPMNAPPLRAE
ncbi:DNA/RNA non-specific endonuclease [Thermobifida halotolerans]|uniref:DNA/RNA non-specific endonuclease n=1 Tax=Thermobifida halotolerans TaxID=483545 RepID=A0A399FXN5_9ACTN|nr:DNA/RNA non-specific endonuclease [Thermobifida halotolerans]UOE21305.1 DNA/RNA non-specific endonuclease [Thermobifida halotolerans]